MFGGAFWALWGAFWGRRDGPVAETVAPAQCRVLKRLPVVGPSAYSGTNRDDHACTQSYTLSREIRCRIAYKHDHLAASTPPAGAPGHTPSLGSAVGGQIHSHDQFRHCWCGMSANRRPAIRSPRCFGAASASVPDTRQALRCAALRPSDGNRGRGQATGLRSRRRVAVAASSPGAVLMAAKAGCAGRAVT